MNTMLALFLGHANPMNAIEADNRFNHGFRRMAARLPKPSAMLMISAHWNGAGVPVSGSRSPEMIDDFSGFPATLSQVLGY